VEVRLVEDGAHDLLHDTGGPALAAELRDWIGRAVGSS